MTKYHSGALLESQLTALAARSARPLQRIKASACPLCDYEAIVRRKLDLDPRTEQITVSIRTFRNHLGRHLEQLALFVLPKEEVTEQADDAVKTDAAIEGEHTLSSEEADTENSDAMDYTSEAEEQDSESRPNLPGDKSTTLGTEVREMTSGLVQSLLDDIQINGVLGTDDLPETSVSAPDLAFVWMPPMDFTPPEADFEVDEDDLVPRREEPMFGGDIFTPGWVRGYGKHKEGFCGRCNPGIWHNIEDSSYNKNLTYMHGIASSGLSLPRPSSIRQVEGDREVWQAYCEACRGWRSLKKSSAGWNWFRHCEKVHPQMWSTLRSRLTWSSIGARIARDGPNFKAFGSEHCQSGSPRDQRLGGIEGKYQNEQHVELRIHSYSAAKTSIFQRRNRSNATSLRSGTGRRIFHATFVEDL